MTNREIFQNACKLLFLLAIIFSIPIISQGFTTVDRISWYHSLPLSPLTPPDYTFGIVWTALYFMMAISAFLVWGKTSPRFFVLQLICNGLWSFVFFYLHAPKSALAVIGALLFFLFLTIKQFYKTSKIAAYLLIPTFLWCLFAFYLNGYIVWNML